MKISVILPCLNAGQYITDALRSIQAQTYPAHEIVVIDNFSTDDTVQKIQESGVEVKFLQVPREGVSVSRNKGIEASTGDWLAYLDADDIWYPEHLERAHRFLSQSNDVAYMSHLDAMSPVDRKPTSAGIAPLFSEPISGLDVYQFLDKWIPRLYFSPSSVVQKKDVVLQVGGFDARFKGVVDVELFIRVIKNHTWSYNPDIDWVYQVGTPNNISSNIISNQRHILQILLSCKKFYQSRVLDKSLNAAASRAMAAAIVDGDKQSIHATWLLAKKPMNTRRRFFFQIAIKFKIIGKFIINLKRNICN